MTFLSSLFPSSLDVYFTLISLSQIQSFPSTGFFKYLSHIIPSRPIHCLFFLCCALFFLPLATPFLLSSTVIPFWFLQVSFPPFPLESFPLFPLSFQRLPPFLMATFRSLPFSTTVIPFWFLQTPFPHFLESLLHYLLFLFSDFLPS